MADGPAANFVAISAMQSRLWLAAAAAAAAVLVYGGFSGGVVPAAGGVLSEHELGVIDAMEPRGQALRLLQRAVNGYRGSLEQISSRVDGWRGTFRMDSELQAMVNTASESHDLRVRQASVEIALAAYGLEKSPATLGQLIRDARELESDRAWRLWAIGLLGNRGVDPAAARIALEEYLLEPDANLRKAAVNALAALGSDEAVLLLVEVFRGDTDPGVKERAACGLADSGLFDRQQRLRAISGFLQAIDDPGLDAQTRSWAYQALREISGQDLGSDPAGWHDWWAREQPR